MLHENLRDVPTDKEHVRRQCDWLVHKMAFLFKKLSKALKRQISCVRHKKHFIVHSIFIQKETSLSYCISSRYTFKCEFCRSNHRHSKLWPSSLLQSRPAHELRNFQHESIVKISIYNCFYCYPSSMWPFKKVQTHFLPLNYTQVVKHSAFDRRNCQCFSIGFSLKIKLKISLHGIHQFSNNHASNWYQTKDYLEN